MGWREDRTIYTNGKELSWPTNIFVNHHDLFNTYVNDPKFLPKSSYRKAIGKRVRTITYGADISQAACDKSGRFATNVTLASGHEACLHKCHKLVMLMLEKMPYICIIVVMLIDGETLSPHKDIQNNRLFKNATTSFGNWTGGLLQIQDNDAWADRDSKASWVIWDARITCHRVTEVKGDRISVTYHTPQHLYRLKSEDWEQLGKSGFPIDRVWEHGLPLPDYSCGFGPDNEIFSQAAVSVRQMSQASDAESMCFQWKVLMWIIVPLKTKFTSILLVG